MRPNHFAHDIGCPHECTERHNHPASARELAWPTTVMVGFAVGVLVGMVLGFVIGWGLM